ncbi:MAG: hypothetical protein HOL15_08085 [Nitrospinaceae bacterium]|jgi:hypothetical protein|nr:hypothetical protein [Nitrospina sp.]MBT5376755.1 hypothetical protein [Nitrospinaceae bacterium]MBT5869056.1 hypothetical protein [Nitrospinaceae bacterium]MBT6345808.1 hypothetical protein [Nitrospina sp.]
MPVTTLEDLFSSPGFLAIFFSVLLTIANIMVGVSILPHDQREKGYRLHRILFGAMIISYGLFLIHLAQINRPSISAYFVLAYLLLAVPFSRRLNVTLHAIISSIALVLISAIAVFNLL